MNRKLILMILIIISVAFMFAYRSVNSLQSINQAQPIMLYPLSQEQRDWIAKKEELVIGIPDDSVPLVNWNAGDKPAGLLIDYIDLIGSGYNMKLRYVPILRSDLKAKLSDGEIDAVLSMQDKVLENSISFTMPIVKAKGVLFMENDVSIDESDKGKGLNILIVEGDPSIQKLKKAFPNIQFLNVKSVQEAVRRLRAGEGNGVAGSETALIYYLGNAYISQNLIKVQGYLYEKNYCFVVSKNNKTLYEILNNAVYHMDNGQVISSLQAKWMGISYPLFLENMTKKTGIIILILFTAILCVFMIFYQSNKSLYEELQQRMELLIESQNEMQTTFDGVTYYLAEVNREGKIVDINKALSQYLQIKRYKAIGLPLVELLSSDKDAREKLTQLIVKTFDEEKENSEEISAGKRIFEVHTFAIKDNREKVRKILFMIVDVTDERSAERQMLQDNKMIAIGQLAAGVAHEIRNPLGLIRNYCYVLKEIDQNDTVTRDEAIRVIERAVDKSSKIIENLLKFSRLSSNKKELTDLSTHFKYIIELQKNWLAKQNIEIYHKYSGPHFAVVNVEAIELVLINLISNGADAIIGESGRIEVSCIHTEHHSILLSVSDTGEGIPTEIVDDIYNPFFTTKANREGNGLGLYIVYNEVIKMGGEIRLDSEIGKGTTFTVTIPIEEGAEAL
ncbi:MAG: transporter substrate-binding domain-containing protein [Eubacteriales bacterium]|nr:transporter substrate-binding domain-containing protein [Eubacteriales bacterium]MDD4583452.1 transporter substrate-binding domain-containing protein [Eubacteriales bacterium]